MESSQIDVPGIYWWKWFFKTTKWRPKSIATNVLYDKIKFLNRFSMSIYDSDGIYPNSKLWGAITNRNGHFNDASIFFGNGRVGWNITKNEQITWHRPKECDFSSRWCSHASGFPSLENVVCPLSCTSVSCGCSLESAGNVRYFQTGSQGGEGPSIKNPDLSDRISAESLKDKKGRKTSFKKAKNQVSKRPKKQKNKFQKGKKNKKQV